MGAKRSVPGSLMVRAASTIFHGWATHSARAFDRSAQQTAASQAAVLRRLATATARTEYGRRHDIKSTADYRAWSERLPVVEWPDLETWIENERERPGALVGDPVVQWARSRCTSCTNKVIPYTSALKTSFARALSLWGHDLLATGLKLRTGYSYLEIDPPRVRWNGSGELADDGDYVARPLAAFLRQVLVVDPAIRTLRTDEGFQRVLALSLISAEELEIISLFHPADFVELCDYIAAHGDDLAAQLAEGQVTCEGHVFRLGGLSTERRAALLAGDLAALWPALKLVSTPAEHVDAPSAAELARRLPQALHQGKGILTTEAPLTIPLGRAGGMVPIVNEVFYELEAEPGSIRPLHEAQVGHEYTLVVSQAGGLVRYRTGERVRVTHLWHALPCLQHTAYA